MQRSPARRLRGHLPQFRGFETSSAGQRLRSCRCCRRAAARGLKLGIGDFANPGAGCKLLVGPHQDPATSGLEDDMERQVGQLLLRLRCQLARIDLITRHCASSRLGHGAKVELQRLVRDIADEDLIVQDRRERGGGIVHVVAPGLSGQ